MKKILRLLLGILCVLSATTAFADGFVPPKGNTGIIILTPKPTTRPHAPSLIYIECEYGVGYVQFSFPAEIYSVNVTLSNDSYVWTGFASRDFPKMEIPVLTGEYTIKCEANDGRVFYGTLEFAGSDD